MSATSSPSMRGATAGVVLFIATVIFPTGCGVAAIALSGVEQFTAGPARRAQMLDETLSRFHRAILWGSQPDAAAFVTREQQLTFFKAYRPHGRHEKLVDIEVRDVVFEEDARRAIVHVAIRGYAVPVYTVEQREQSELWRFDRISGGWRLEDPNYRDSRNAVFGVEAVGNGSGVPSG